MSAILLESKLVNAEQVHQLLVKSVWPWAKQHLLAGRELVAQFRLAEDAKTDKQRGYFHGVVLAEIARQAEANGQKFPLKVWKEHFRSEFLGFKTVTHINPVTGKKSRRRVRISTEDLGVRAYSDYIDRVTAYAATELNVRFSVSWADYQVDPETGEILE